ncbi:hypothetical protein [Mycobacterium decipiens]|uniref:hypothetical protein n=1 Tax=Mycobacterium decipiens TaxID=1430326 RepID=UPI0013FD4640|nr:hypothetical protein [Mycobacterium decipiens]
MRFPPAHLPTDLRHGIGLGATHHASTNTLKTRRTVPSRPATTGAAAIGGIWDWITERIAALVYGFEDLLAFLWWVLLGVLDFLPYNVFYTLAMMFLFLTTTEPFFFCPF